MYQGPGTKTLGSEWIGMEADTDIYGYHALGVHGDELGVVQDYVFDELGHLRYLVIEHGFWLFGKRFLVPVGLVQVDDRKRRVTIHNLDWQAVEILPAFKDLDDLEPWYENNLLAFYTPSYDLADPEPRFFETPERLKVLEDRLETTAFSY